VRNPFLVDRILERAGHVLLANDVRKFLGTVFARQDLIAHAECLIIPWSWERLSLRL
jgi:hypothetical protein